MKKIQYESSIVHTLEFCSRIIALLVSATLLIEALLVFFNTVHVLFQNQIDKAIQDALFVLILLELFYITRSFVKYGSINVGIVVNVGIIVCIKELIFKIDSLTWQSAVAFGIVLISLSVVYLAETLHFQKQK